MRRFLAVSAVAHALAALVLVVWWWHKPPPAGEVPGTVEVLFGSNAEHSGTPASAVSQASAATKADAAASADSGAVSAGAPAANAAGSEDGPTAPVRLGEGDLGLKLSDAPDANMVEAQADPGNNAPKYPPAAFRLGQQGVVVVRMHIDEAGRVADAEVLESSGSPILDEAARAALAKWHFIPALRNGVAVPSYRDQATNFILEHGP